MMNNSLKNFSLEDLKKEVLSREERHNQINNWKKTILANYLQKNSPNSNEVDHIMDYFYKSEKLVNLSRLSYSDAHMKSLKWTKTINLKNKNLKDAGLTHKVLDLENGLKIVRLVDQTSRDWEGLQMGNCVAKYDIKTRLYSLRDKDELPHVTIELTVDDRKIEQIKGSSNAIPHFKYLNHIFKFLEYNDIVLMNEDYLLLGLIILNQENQEYLEENFSGYSYYVHEKVLYLRHDSTLKLKQDLITTNQYLFDTFVECNLCISAQRQWISLGIDLPHEYLNNSIYAASLEDVKFALSRPEYDYRSIDELKNYIRMLKYSDGTDDEIKRIKEYLKDLIYKETFIGWKICILNPYLEQINCDKKEKNKLAHFIKKEKEENKYKISFPRSELHLKYYVDFYFFSKKYPGQEVYTIPKEGEALVCSLKTESNKINELASWGLSKRYSNHYCYVIYNLQDNTKLGIILAHKNDRGRVIFDKEQSQHVDVFVNRLFPLVEDIKSRGLQISFQQAGLIPCDQISPENLFLNIETEDPFIFNYKEKKYFFIKNPIKFKELPQRKLRPVEINLLTHSHSTYAFLQMGIIPVVSHLALISAANIMDTKMVSFFLNQDTGYLENYLGQTIIKTSKIGEPISSTTQLIIDHARNRYGLFPKDSEWLNPSSDSSDFVAKAILNYLTDNDKT